LPNEVISEEQYEKLNSQDISIEDKILIKQNVQSKIKLIEGLKIKIEGFLRAVLSESSDYISDLNKIPFYTVEVIDNSKISNEIWNDGKNKLLSLLSKAKVEFEEKIRIGNQQNSLKFFLKSNQARGIVLASLLSLLVGFLSKDYINDFFGKASWNKLGSAFANFEVIEVKKTVDLTEWTPTLTANEDELSGKSIYDDQYQIRKIRDEGKDFCVTAGSSGSEPKFTSQTHHITQTPIEIKLEGWPNLKKQVLAILDVEDEKTNTIFSANIRSVRYRGFADPKANWCSIGIWHPTRKLTYRVLFPKNKMGNTFVFSTSFFYDRNNQQKLNPDSTHLTIDSTSITWTIDQPIIGNAYRIGWNW
jgi:hypothetical protein